MDRDLEQQAWAWIVENAFIRRARKQRQSESGFTVVDSVEVSDPERLDEPLRSEVLRLLNSD